MGNKDSIKIVKKRIRLRAQREHMNNLWERKLVEWISCQTDVNDLVQEDNIEDDETEDIQPSPPEDKPIICDTEDDGAEEVEEDEEDGEVEEVQEVEEVIVAVVDDKEAASLDEWEIKKQLCRCCLVEGTFDRLHAPAPAGDVTYDDMLLQCFSIELFPVSSEVTTPLRGVCGLCAARLRDAHAFRHQVSASDARFRDLYTRGYIKVAGAAEVEIELKRELPRLDDNFDNEMDETENSEELLVEKETESTKNSTTTEEYDVGGDEIVTAPKKVRKEPQYKKKKLPKSGFAETNELEQQDGVYKCMECKKTCTSLKTFRSHYTTKHVSLPLPNVLRCSHCENSFATHTQLMIHKLKDHNIDERYKCGACDKRFNARKQLELHLDSFHMMGEVKKCSVCDFECYSTSQLKRHKVKHKTTKDYHCKYCDMSFLRINTLNFHEKIHFGKKQCAECGKVFLRKASLYYHMAKHHPNVKF